MKEPEYTEEEINENLRRNTFNSIALFASKEDQLKYQNDVPIANVLHEIFTEWGCTYGQGTEEFKALFTMEEQKLLDWFDNIVAKVCEDNSDAHIHTIYEYIETKNWKILNEAANKFLAGLKILAKEK